MSLEASTAAEISRIRNRAYVLDRLVPKLMGIAVERGHKIQGFRDGAAHVTSNLLVSMSPIDACRFCVSVYWSLDLDRKKVFSAHVTNAPSAVDPQFYRYCNRCVGLLSWRRGSWEDLVMADPASPRIATELYPYGDLGSGISVH